MSGVWSAERIAEECGLEKVVVQVDIQRRGGVCSKYPTACLVKDIIEGYGLRLRELVVFDTTYGRGVFWAASRPSMLIGADIRAYDWVVRPDIFIPHPAWKSWKILRGLGVKPDIVAIDPPWIDRGNSKRRYYGGDLALGTPEMIIRHSVEGAKELRADYILLHYKRRLDIQGYRLVHARYFLPVTRYSRPDCRFLTFFGLYLREHQ